MIIHVVKQGDTIRSIADQYGVSASRLVIDNGLLTPNKLIIGQTIVITYPEVTYVVEKGDTLNKIAELHNTTIMQLLRNNPYLLDREYIYPGENLIISYDQIRGKLRTNGVATEFINTNVLIKTLPNLTYLSILGYRITDGANILDINDRDIIRLTKEFGVAPIMMLTTLTVRGEEDLEVALQVLNDEVAMDTLIDNVLIILKEKGFYGVSVTFQLLEAETLLNYKIFTSKIAERMKEEGFKVFFTLTPNPVLVDGNITFERLDYSYIGEQSDSIVLMDFNWGVSFGPPMPISSITNIQVFLDYILQQIPPSRVVWGQQLIGYDWELPYTIGVTRANSLTYNSALSLADQYGVTILFDEVSQTPYFFYTRIAATGIAQEHVVWFIDPRSIQALLTLISELNLAGIGIWNVMTYNPQLWLVINSQYEIEKIYN